MKPDHSMTSMNIEKEVHRLIKKLAKEDDRTPRSLLRRALQTYQSVVMGHVTVSDDRRRR